jgi:hypothetical protein
MTVKEIGPAIGASLAGPLGVFMLVRSASSTGKRAGRVSRPSGQKSAGNDSKHGGAEAE